MLTTKNNQYDVYMVTLGNNVMFFCDFRENRNVDIKGIRARLELHYMCKFDSADYLGCCTKDDFQNFTDDAYGALFEELTKIGIDGSHLVRIFDPDAFLALQQHN